MNKITINLTEIGIHIHLEEKGKKSIESLMIELKIKFEWGSLHHNEPRLIVFSNDEKAIQEFLARIGIMEGIARSIDQLKDLSNF